jgi:hypothetical protein
MVVIAFEDFLQEICTPTSKTLFICGNARIRPVPSFITYGTPSGSGFRAL